MNGIWPLVTSSPSPTTRATCSRRRLQRDVERLEHAGRESFLLAQQPEQDVLGADVVVREPAGLVLGEDDHLPRTLGEALEHPETLRAAAAAACSVPRP